MCLARPQSGAENSSSGGGGGPKGYRRPTYILKLDNGSMVGGWCVGAVAGNAQPAWQGYLALAGGRRSPSTNASVSSRGPSTPMPATCLLHLLHCLSLVLAPCAGPRH